MNGLDDVKKVIHEYLEYRRGFEGIPLSFSAWLNSEGYDDVKECVIVFGFAGHGYTSRKLCEEDVDAVFGKDRKGVKSSSLVYEGRCSLMYTDGSTTLHTSYRESWKCI